MNESSDNAPPRRRSRWKWILGIAACVVLVPLLLDGCGKRELTDADRQEGSGFQFVNLSDGVTRYAWAGPEDGPKVVLVHGLSSPCFIWEKTVTTLADAGFRVLRYDLFGRGLSDRPKCRYTAELYDRQLVELLDAQGVTEPIHVAGLSMGGAISVNFTGRHPERVARLVLFAPAGMNDRTLGMQIVGLPGVGEWVSAVLGDLAYGRYLPRKLSKTPEDLAAYRMEYTRQLGFKGYKRALLSSMRYGPVTGLDAAYRRLGGSGKDVLLFWGTEDNVLPHALHERVQELVPQVKFHSVPGGGHALPYGAPEEVGPVLVAFLEGH